MAADGERNCSGRVAIREDGVGGDGSWPEGRRQNGGWRLTEGRAKNASGWWKEVWEASATWEKGRPAADPEKVVQVPVGGWVGGGEGGKRWGGSEAAIGAAATVELH